MANKGIQAKAYELTFKFKLCQQKDTDKNQGKHILQFDTRKQTLHCLRCLYLN